MIKNELDRLMKENPFLALGDAIYQCLFNAIIKLHLPPDTKLNESKIAEQLNVSRTPVKMALARLTEERLVHKKDGKISVVSPMARKDCRMLYEGRMAVEGYAAYLAADRITEGQLSELKLLVIEYNKIGINIATETYADCDHKFHAVIINACYNPFIQHMYNSIESSVLHYRHCLLHEIGRDRLQPILYYAARHHQTIYNALKIGFADTARTEIERDISGMIDVFCEWKNM